MDDFASADGWEKVYAGLSAADLLREQDVVLAALREMVADEFERRYKAGDYQIVSTNGVYKGKHSNPYDVYQIRSLGNGLIGKCTLPDHGFEDAYKLKAQCAWLQAASANRP